MERRKFARLPEAFRVTLKEVAYGSSRAKGDAETKDLSAGGLLITAREAYSPGTLLELSIVVPRWAKYRPGFLKFDWTSVPQPLVVLGRVVRVEERKRGHLYEIGVAFTGMDPIEQEALKRLLEDRGLQGKT